VLTRVLVTVLTRPLVETLEHVLGKTVDVETAPVPERVVVLPATVLVTVLFETPDPVRVRVLVTVLTRPLVETPEHVLGKTVDVETAPVPESVVVLPATVLVTVLFETPDPVRVRVLP